ncbi:MAG: serine/threonine protein kinase [Rhodopirellula sp.]|nr:serine/threonine protein kinase [Rhodopirellula sp.]OUX49818.1 MAG: serine/threonine protein kinase [Rhodopirellula sp. TMED283]
MRNNELSAWTLLVASAILGSVTMLSLSGCKPPATTRVDVSTEEYVESNTTARDSNVTTTTSQAVETPMPADDAASENAVVAVKDAAAADASNQLIADNSKEVVSAGGDWPQWGGTRQRNNTPGVKNLPLEWNIGKFDRRSGDWDDTKAKNIRWFSNLGSQTYGNPVIAGGQVYVGTNNGAGHLKRFPSKVDLGCLLAFDEKTGDFKWQHSSEKLITGRVHDWPLQGICCSPLVEGNRLWFVTSRGEVRCLDTEGFYDNEDDGPVKDELVALADIMNAGPSAEAFELALASLAEGKLTDAAKAALADSGAEVEGEVTIKTVTEGKSWTAKGKFNGVDRELTIKQIGPRLQFFKKLSTSDKRDADVIWIYNMMGPDMGISQHNMCSCSVTSYGDLLFVHTGNGLDESHLNLPAPDAPSFICMNKNTGEVLWTDDAPAKNILHGQWSSPTVGTFEGVPQALFAGGDGILYSFRADEGKDGNPELLWKFDCNPKTSKWVLGGEGTRNNLIATPVVYDGLVYIAVGQDPEHGEGEGHLWCINPNMRGDISPMLAMKLGDDGKRIPIPHRRIQAVELENGEVEIENPNSGVVWHYGMLDTNGDQEIDFEEEMHRSIGTCAIKDDILYVADFSGLVHCLDAKGTKEGKPIVHFTYDMLAQSWGSPLIADGHVFIGDEDGDVAIFEFGKDNVEPIDEINMGSSVYSTPVGANESIFISTKDKLFSIGK